MTNVENTFGAYARIRILEGKQRRNTDEYVVGSLEEDLCVDPSMLQKYCFSSPTPQALDLVTFLAAIRFADRTVKRRHVDAWARKIELSVPVLDANLWQRQNLVFKLQECLGYLTGDDWELSFVKRRRAVRLRLEGHTDHVVGLPEGAYVGIPYSDGLDSYAQSRLLRDREPESKLLCTFTNYYGGPTSWSSYCKRRQTELVNIVSIPVPFHVSEPRHAESSFRTRPFIFYSLAAYAAHLAKSRRVVIPENGQGSIGGSLVLLGNEAPHRSCYPGFLWRLQGVLAEILGTQIAFEHPALLQTKGQVLRDLSHVEDIKHWGGKRSCSHDQRHASHDGERIHCGVCGGCILRRVSIQSAGLNDPTKYLFNDVRATTLENSVPSGASIRALEAMKDVARNSIRDMQRLADASDGNDGRLEEVALDVADASGLLVSDALVRVRAMLEQHKREWGQFLMACGPKSWVHSIGEN